MNTHWKQRMLIPVMLVGLAVSACDGDLVGVPGGGGDARVVVDGSGRVVTEVRSVAGFTGISLYSEGLVTIVQGDAESLTIKTDDNLVEYIETTVTDGVLNILLREDAAVDLEPTSGIEFDITVVALDAVDLYGAGAFEIDNITTDRLDLSVSGAGDIEIANLDATELDVVLTGVGAVVVAGEVGRERLRITGTGEIDASAVSADQATVALSGIGDVAVWAIDRLDATISGIGEVRYYGSPSVTQSVTGSGGIRSMGEK